MFPAHGLFVVNDRSGTRLIESRVAIGRIATVVRAPAIATDFRLGKDWLVSSDSLRI